MDEQGDAGPLSSSVLESDVSVTVPEGDDPLKGRFSSEGLVEGSYSDGEGDEIMVEVVGSDVFVDGVGGNEDEFKKEGVEQEIEYLHGEGDFGLRKIEGLGVEKWDSGIETGVDGFQEMAVLSGECTGAEHVFEMEKGEVLKLSSTAETGVVSVEEVEVSVTEEMIVEVGEARDGKSFDGGNSDRSGLSLKGVGVSNDEAWNPGIEYASVSSSLMPEATSPCFGEEAAVAVRAEGFSGRDEAQRNGVASDNSVLSGEDQSSVIETLNEEAAMVERESVRDEAPCGIANANLSLSGEDQISVTEIISEATEKDSASHVHSKSSDNPAEAAGNVQLEAVYNEDILHSDNGTIQDNVHHDAECDEIPKDVERDGAQFSASGLELHEHTQIESGNSVGLDGSATETTQLFFPSVSPPCVVDHELTEEAESDSNNNAIFSGEQEISCLQTQVVDERETPMVNSEDSSFKREDASSYGKDKTFFHSQESYGVEAEIANPQSSHAVALVTGRNGGMEAEIEELLDCTDKAPWIDAPDVKSSCLENNEDTKIMKLDESSVIDVALGCISSICESTQTVNGGIVDLQDSHAFTTNILLDAAKALTSSDKDVLVADSETSANHLLVAEGENEVMDDKNKSNSLANAFDGDASNNNHEKLDTQHFGEWEGKEGAEAAIAASLDEHIDTEISKEDVVETVGTIKAPACDTSDIPNLSLLGNEESPIGEMVGVSETENVARDESPVHFTRDGSPLAGEAKINNKASPEVNLVVVEQYVETKKQEVVEQQAETVIDMMDLSQGEDWVISNDVIPVSGVDVTEGSGLFVNSDSFSGEGNSISCLPEGNVHLCSNDLPPQDQERNMESCTFNAVDSNELLNQGATVEDESCKTSNVHVPAAEVEVDENCSHSSETNHLKTSRDRRTISDNTLKSHQSGYLLPPENEGEFSVSDLVWGKVRSHPWWPGQIFDPADASKKALKYFKKDCFLVAYFGDRTFAWNDASVLKPFRSHFSQIENQSNSETFQNAVSSALAEVSRRVEIGLTCSCTPKDVVGKLEYQIVENAGISGQSSKQYCKDKSSAATSFEPDKLISYVRGLAKSQSGRADRLDLMIAQAQISAFSRYKGYRQPPEFHPGGKWLEIDTDLVDHEKDDQNLLIKNISQKRKLDSKDSLQPKKKEKNLLKSMGDTSYDEDDSDGKPLGRRNSSASARKTKARNSIADGSDKRISIYAAKVSTTKSTAPKPSFKIGDCILRVANQLTGSASFKSNSDQPGNEMSPQISDSERGSIGIPTEFFSVHKMLLQLKMAAKNPQKGHILLRDTIAFFSSYRSLLVSKRKQKSLGKPGGGKKRKTPQAIGKTTAEEFEFDEANDSYWTDRVVENGENGEQYQLEVLDVDKPAKSRRGPHSKKRYSSGNYELEEPFEFIDRKKQKSSPAELILNFGEGSLPSEMNINKIFKRFGPLKESETEVDGESRRARVVFKKGSDAEVAYSSAGTFNIFGSTPVTYELSYEPSGSFKPLPPAISPIHDETTRC